MLKIRPVWKADELRRFGELEEKYHYMGETHSGGDTLRLVIEDDGEWVAIMVWGGACYHLLRRDDAGKNSGVRVHGQTRRHKLPSIQGRTPVGSRHIPANARG